MRLAPSKAKVRTPKQMVKAALKTLALHDLGEHKLPSEAKVSIEYRGVKHDMIATPTINAETGQIMLNFSASGQKRLPICEIGVVDESGKQATRLVTFGVNGNIMTGLAVDEDKLIEVQNRYGLVIEPEVTEDENLDAGETTI